MLKKSNRIYLDYAATTPTDPRVLRAMQPYFSGEFGNPGSLHSFGQKALGAVDAARETIANALGIGFREIIFTGSATEANNLVLRGVAKTAMQMMRMHANTSNNSRHSSLFEDSHRMRIIVSAIEHESVLETARDLEKEGVEVVYLPVGKKGVVSLSALRSSLTPNTVLVSIMYVNNETGVVQPIGEIAKIIRDFREEKSNEISRFARNDRTRTSHLAPRTYPLFHTDAAQAFQFFSCRPAELGVDLMTLSAHKIHGPKGVGVLYTKLPGARFEVLGSSGNKKLAPRTSYLAPLLTGGGQEYGMRSGTENVPAIAGFGKAIELAVAEREKNTKYIKMMRDRFWKKLHGAAKDEISRFARNDEVELGSPHILNLWIKGHKAEDVLSRLDLAGVAVSSGSACRSRSFEPSHVLKAMGLRDIRIAESIRVSFGRETTLAEVAQALRVFRDVLR